MTQSYSGRSFFVLRRVESKLDRSWERERERENNRHFREVQLQKERMREREREKETG